MMAGADVGPVMGQAWMTLLILTRWKDTIMSSNYYDDEGYLGDHYVGPSKYDYVLKECKRCGCKVEMSSDHGTCDSCANEMERGWEY